MKTPGFALESQSVCQCRICGGEIVYEVSRAFPSSRPHICDACDSKSKAAEAKSRAAVREAASLSCIPYHIWDHALGNGNALRLVTQAAAGGSGLYILGDTGAGKTRAVAQAAIRATRAGFRIAWRNCGEWFDSLSALASEKMGAFNAEKAAALTADVLILDDLGKGKISERLAAALFDVVDRSIREGVRLWITSNHTLEGLDAKLGPEYGPPTIRRIVERCVLVEVPNA